MFMVRDKELEIGMVIVEGKVHVSMPKRQTD